MLHLRALCVLCGLIKSRILLHPTNGLLWKMLLRMFAKDISQRLAYCRLHLGLFRYHSIIVSLAYACYHVILIQTRILKSSTPIFDSQLSFISYSFLQTIILPRLLLTYGHGADLTEPNPSG